jgi:hypothetical protein
MNLDYYNLPFGAQLLLWTSRLAINTSCRSSPNKYELVDTAYKKVGLEEGLFLLKDFLVHLRKNKSFKLQSICSRYLISNEINLINCIENNKYSNFDNSYYLKIWSINNNISEFCEAAQKLSNSFKHLKLNTDISLIINNTIKPDKTNYRNITIH